MVSPRQRASILKARAQAERSLKRYESLIAKARQALRQQKPDIQKAIAAATADERDIQAGTEGALESGQKGRAWISTRRILQTRPLPQAPID